MQHDIYIFKNKTSSVVGCRILNSFQDISGFTHKIHDPNLYECPFWKMQVFFFHTYQIYTCFLKIAATRTCKNKKKCLLSR